MHAETEFVSGVIRVFPDGARYGDRYRWAATVRWIDPVTVELCGIVRKVTPAIWDAVSKELQRLGIAEIVSAIDGKQIRVKVGSPYAPVLGPLTRGGPPGKKGE